MTTDPRPTPISVGVACAFCGDVLGADEPMALMTAPLRDGQGGVTWNAHVGYLLAVLPLMVRSRRTREDFLTRSELERAARHA